MLPLWRLKRVFPRPVDTDAILFADSNDDDDDDVVVVVVAAEFLLFGIGEIALEWPSDISL